VSYPPVDGWSR